mgnify:CR=1 FL=1
MNTNIRVRIARYVAVSVVLGGAALGMAGVASAGTYSQPADPHFNAPSVTAHPAAEMLPGWRNHHGTYHIQHLVNNGFHR